MKLVVVILVTALLMYTCQTFARNVSLGKLLLEKMLLIAFDLLFNFH